ncbi:fused MFS/spermidine synthase [Gordonia sp. TBRC 11910]|uniref:Fused MFS/spermidine synthase n=1 Tax=Gordonia asplenii TaxID=2725283 RepID=A0A848KQB8_9ACTN|nr:fused MFS/spermidine synthase [Gordonia asplenii]NMO01204.1 fused MFS/spermidine synthase [Gordonia asplenii]
MAKAAPIPVAGVYPIDTGTAELTRDRFTDGWLLSINGAHSSHIDPDDPLALDFEYMRYMAAVIAERVPDDSPVRVLHLGGAACALPRYLAQAYPASKQVAVEVDAELARLVRDWFDLPRAPRLRIRVGDGRAVAGSLTPASRDVVVRDAFGGEPPRTPAHLTTIEFTEAIRRVLVPGGLYLANCGDSRDLSLARAEVATVSAVFAHVALVADAGMLKGRRTGNIVIAASDTPIEATSELVRTLLADPLPAQVMTGARAREFGRAEVRRDRSVGFPNDECPTG